MDNSEFDTNMAHARRACRFCHKRKIRCGRELPQCSSCKVNKRICSYGQHLPSSSGQNVAQSIAARLVSVQEEHNSDAALLFLDTEFFHRSHLELLILGKSKRAPQYVLNYLGSHRAVRQMATQFFDLTHPWFPIVSKRRFFDQLLNPLLPAREDVPLLCLCMKLFASSGTEHDSKNRQHPEYFTAVHYFCDLHKSSLKSLEVLQAGILLAVYELGHALYPAAYTTIGVCITYGLSLGLNWRTTSAVVPLEFVQGEKEEHIRAWWAIYLLERIANLGNPQQICLTPDPEVTVPLPCRDTDWNRGTHHTPPSILSSPPESMGRFGTVIQAAYLLSCVQKLVSDTSMDLDSRQSETEQLDKTLHALIRYSQTLAGSTMSIICYQTALAFSALMILYNSYMKNIEDGNRARLQSRAVIVLDNAADVACKVAEKYLAATSFNYEHGDIPPFVLPWMYMAAVRFIDQNHDDSTFEYKDRLNIIEKALRVLSEKWNSSALYLKLLAARQVMAI